VLAQAPTVEVVRIIADTDKQRALIVKQIVALAARHAIPTLYTRREFAVVGGLMSYGSSVSEQYRRTATYVDKIFKGAKPADLPVEQPMIFEFYINGKTAKALGLKIPYDLQIMVDKVIE